MLFYNGHGAATPTHGGTANTRTNTPYFTSPNAVATVLAVMPLLEAHLTLLLPPLMRLTHLFAALPCAVLRRVTFHTLPLISTSVVGTVKPNGVEVICSLFGIQVYYTKMPPITGAVCRLINWHIRKVTLRTLL